MVAAIRDHPNKPAAAQCHVLTVLALRLDWASGTGHASLEVLTKDAGVEERTARRAIDWARGMPRDERFFLARTRRGHRLGDGTRLASEWLLRLPTQLDTEALLRFSSGQQGGLNRTLSASQPDSSTAPSRPSSSRPSSSRAVGAQPRRTGNPKRGPACGKCSGDPERMINWLDDHPTRCPDCHPLAGVTA